MKELPPHCPICGRFINMIKDEYVTEFIPDTEFTTEETIFIHKKCNEQENSK